MSDEPKVYRVKLSELIPDANNANLGSERGRYLLEESLQQFGAGRSVLLDRDGRIIAGNKTHEVAGETGFQNVIIVETSGDELVAVKRTDLDLEDDPRARQLAYADNRAGELSLEWNTEQLVSDLEAGLDLSAMFRGDELEELVQGALNGNEPPADPGPQVDKAAELQEKWGVQSGDLWVIPSKAANGEHRVVCGDCTDAAVVDRVMGGDRINCIVTDPPYGVDYDGGTTIRDKLSGDQSPALYLPALTCWKSYCANDVALYLWYADGDQAVAQAVAQAGWHVRRNLIWNKNLAQYGALSQQYKQKHEPFLYCHLKGQSPYWAGDASEVTVWDVSRESVNDLHPTQKPPALFERAIRNSSKGQAFIFDGFLGSGTTLVACERLGRLGRGIEIEPKYVAVTLQRLSDMGLTPKRVDQ